MYVFMLDESNSSVFIEHVFCNRATPKEITGYEINTCEINHAQKKKKHCVFSLICRLEKLIGADCGMVSTDGPERQRGGGMEGRKGGVDRNQITNSTAQSGDCSL